MARQESQSKLLYYPTPDEQTTLIRSWFTMPETARLIDPCCGEGEALQTFQSAGGATTWGIELSPFRAEKAAKLLDIVLPADFFNVTWGDDTASLVFLNPPYDYSNVRDEAGHAQRFEWLFLQRVTRKIVTGGQLVLIVPQMILDNEQVARHLAGYYERALVFRFTGDEFDKFKQVVVLAQRKKHHAPNHHQIQGYRDWGRCDKTQLTEICVGDGRYHIPPAPHETGPFHFTPLGDEQLAALTAQTKLLASRDWMKASYVRPIGAPIHPVVQEKIGHVAMQLSSGDVGVVEIELTDSKALAKGTLSKEIQREDTPKYNDSGERIGQSVKTIEKLATHIAITKASGEIQQLSSAASVAEFMTEHGQAIARALLARNVPIYDFKPTETEWASTQKVAKNLPALPGRKERGLFPMQAHLAIAAKRTLLRHHHIIPNCDMGFGKTATAIATAELMNQWPILVMCPDHMVEKWRRDIERVANPADPIQARIIDTAARASRSWYNDDLLPMLAATFCQVESVQRLQREPENEDDDGRRLQLTVTAATSENINGFHKAASHHRLNPKLIKTLPCERGGRWVIEIKDKDKYTLIEFIADYRAGKLGRKAAAICAFDPAKHGSGFVDATIPKRARVLNQTTDELEIKTVRTCPGCGKLFRPQEKHPRQCANIINERARMLDGSIKPIERTCGTFNEESSRWRRCGIAELVATKYRHVFKLYIADEIHKCKSGDTDIGTADGQFISGIKYSLALTGTLFGGAASSLFYLLYRRSNPIRSLYNFHDGHSLWVDHFGIWERKWEERENEKGPRGVTTGIKRFQVRSTEKPGISPAIIRYILPQVVFGKITDLGYELPPLSENIQVIEMDGEQAAQYHAADDYLLDLAKQMLVTSGDMAYVAAWFSTVRQRANSAFRDETVSCHGQEIYSLPAVTTGIQPLPKEQALADKIKQNMAAGRKTLVYCEQTGTRDIRGRLVEMLNILAPTARVAVLNSSTSPKKRERWIENTAPGLDVLIVNPKLVETGLDLVMFQEIVFFEITYSLYTLWQAMKRVWRLGQGKPVTTTFMVYRGTVEQAALALMGVKMKFAQMLYGDNASGVLVDEAGAEEIEDIMIRKALQGVTYNDLGEMNQSHVFTTPEQRPAMDVTESPMGSPTAVSPRLPDVQHPADIGVRLTWAAAQDLMALKKPKKAKAPAPELQGSLF